MTNLSNKLTENRRLLNDQLNELKEIGAQKSDLIRDLCDKHDDIEEEIRLASLRIDFLGQKLNGLLADKSATGDILKSLGFDRDAAAEENVRRGQELGGLEADVAGLTSDSDALKTRLSELTLRRDDLATRIETLQTSTRSKVSSLQEDIKSKTADLDIVSNEEDKLKERFALLSPFPSGIVCLLWLYWPEM